MLSECSTPLLIGSSSGRRETSERAPCRRSPRTPPSNWSASTPGRRTRSGATPASCAASSRLASRPPTTSTRCSRCKPDCVVYNPMWIDVDELVRILEAGVNVVSSAAFITGHNLGAGRDRISRPANAAARRMFGSGISPGFAELLAIVAATICDRVDKVTVDRGRRHHVLRLTGHRATGGLRHADRRPRPAGDGGQGHRGVRRGRAPGGRRARASNSTRSRCEAEIRPDHRGPRRWRRGPSRPGAWPASPPAGRASSAARSSSTSTSGGERARRSSPTGRSSGTAG